MLDQSPIIDKYVFIAEMLANRNNNNVRLVMSSFAGHKWLGLAEAEVAVTQSILLLVGDVGPEGLPCHPAAHASTR